MDGLKNSGVKTLRFLEKYTKTDMVYLAKGGFWLTLGQVISSASVFITSIAFANLLDPEIFGIYKYILSIASLLAITTLTGMDSSMAQSISRGYEGDLQTGIKEKMKWGVFGSGISLLIAGYYYFQGNIPISLSFLVVSVFMPFMESVDAYNSLLWGKKLFKTQTYYNIIKKIVSLVSIVGILFITQNISIILTVYFLAIIIPNIGFLYRTIKKYQENRSTDGGMISYGKKLSFIGIMGIVIAELDRIIVFQYIGATNLAVYSIATAPTDQIKGVFKNINTLAMPKISQKTPEEVKKNIWKKLTILFILSVLVVGLYIVIAPIFFKIFFPKYIESIIYSQILSISLIPVILSSFLYTILEAQKSTQEIYNYNIYSNIFNIIVLIPLIYYAGLWGAILTRILTRIFTLILTINSIKKI